MIDACIEKFDVMENFEFFFWFLGQGLAHDRAAGGLNSPRDIL
jgi:hypothetical protein